MRLSLSPVAEKTIKLNAQGFNDGQYSNMDARDIRFNQTKKYLYVTAMGWPEDGRLVIKSLGQSATALQQESGEYQLSCTRAENSKIGSVR